MALSAEKPQEEAPEVLTDLGGFLRPNTLPKRKTLVYHAFSGPSPEP